MRVPGYSVGMLLFALIACSGNDAGTDDSAGGKDPKAPVAPPLVINEFLAANDTINADQAGEYDDWVEIYNPSDRIVQFTGLYLTDDRTGQPTQWALPDGQGISAGGYALFWGDGQVEQGIDHLSFKLNKAGDEISLFYVVDGFDPIQVDAITYEAQTPDLSFARVPDGALEWVQGAPTPNASNG